MIIVTCYYYSYHVVGALVQTNDKSSHIEEQVWGILKVRAIASA